MVFRRIREVFKRETTPPHIRAEKESNRQLLKNTLLESFDIASKVYEALETARATKGSLNDERTYYVKDAFYVLKKQLGELIKNNEILELLSKHPGVLDHISKIQYLHDEIRNKVYPYLSLEAKKTLDGSLWERYLKIASKTEGDLREIAEETAKWPEHDAKEAALSARYIRDKYVLSEELLEKLEQFIQAHKELMKLAEERK